MITTQPQDQQTGSYSRIVNPRDVIVTSAVDRRIHAGTNPRPPVRNLLAGTPGVGLISRFKAWLRGE